MKRKVKSVAKSVAAEVGVDMGARTLWSVCQLHIGFCAWLLLVSTPGYSQGVIDSLKKTVGPKPAYSVIRAGYKAEDLSIWGRAVDWLDNNRVIFFGYKSDSPKEKGIWIWDVDRNLVSLYAKVSASAAFCYARGYIRYMVSDPAPAWKDGRLTSPQVWRLGEFGKEKEWHTPESEMTSQGAEQARRDRFYSRFTCKEYPQLSEKYKEKFKVTSGVFPLHDGDGALDLFEAASPHDVAPARWLHLERGTSVDLRLARCAIAPSSVKYIEHLGAYLLYGWSPPPDCESKGHWPAGVLQPMLLLYPAERKIERRDIPAPSWGYGAIHATLSTQGLLVSRGLNRSGDGIYLVRGKQETLVIEGKGGATDLAVSPNGCRLVANTPKFDALGLQAVDLCRGGK